MFSTSTNTQRMKYPHDLQSLQHRNQVLFNWSFYMWYPVVGVGSGGPSKVRVHGPDGLRKEIRGRKSSAAENSNFYALD